MAGGMADIHLCTTPLPLPPHGPGFVIDGSQTVLVNNMPACRMGDTILEALGPPNKIAMGCFTVLIGGSSLSGSAGLGAVAGAVAEQQEQQEQQRRRQQPHSVQRPPRHPRPPTSPECPSWSCLTVMSR